MKFLFRLSLTLICFMLVTGCAKYNQHAADAVKVKAARPDHCVYLGHVYSVTPSGMAMSSGDASVKERHFNVLKLKAHDLGANTIVITTSKSTFTKKTGPMHHDMEADAYKCQ